MQLTDFNYELPAELIARYPAAQRSASRLLCLNRQNGEIIHQQFKQLPNLLRPNDLLVFNNTRVIRARLFGQKPSGGKVELLIERVLNPYQALAHIRASKACRPGTQIILSDQTIVTVLGREQDLFCLQFPNTVPIFTLLDNIGHIPLPPYFGRDAEPLDDERYQTVYADLKGSVAAPTAGLHFDAELFQQLKIHQIASSFLTLHVGAGTFQPVRVQDLKTHVMHQEYMEVPMSVCEQIQHTKAHGGRVIAVGTTTVRSLETAAQSGQLKPYQGETRLFIYPGYQFQCIDGMITNFHLPESSLLMLVSAFAGYEATMAAYREAVTQQYRFFSYGDAMLIL